MIKVHFPEFDQETVLKEAGKIITVLDNNSETNIKSAASSAFSENFIKENLPDDNHYLIHFIAVGDDEYYGFNRNGDGFKSAANKDYCHTFVDYGHFFREHNNSDAKFKIGDIKAAAYNEKMHRSEVIVHGHKKLAEEEYALAKAGKALSCSMACFPAGEQVLTAHGHYIPIEFLKPGDKVITHAGKSAEVKFVTQSKYNGPATVLDIYGLPGSITCTNDHLFLTSKDGYKEANKLTKKDRLLLPINREVQSDIDPDLAWLLGLYLAEGHIFCKGKLHRMEITLGAHESELIKKTQTLLQKFTQNKVGVFYRKENSSVRIRCSTTNLLSKDVDFIKWFSEQGGKLCHSKKLSKEMMYLNPPTQLKILEGWLDGDGTWAKQTERICGVTTSYNLAKQLQLIGARNNIPISVSQYQHNKKKKMTYNLQIRSCFCNDINFIRKPTNWRYTQKIIKRKLDGLKHQKGKVASYTPKPFLPVEIDGDYLLLSIRKVKKSRLNEIVYDLEVINKENDHSFTVNGIAVHNCKINYDVCSCCGNEAPHRGHYCTHLKNHMGEYLPEFKKFAYADNPHPVFFDLSRVKNPADRIAHYLQYAYTDSTEKAARKQNNPTIGGAELAELLGLKEASSIKFTTNEIALLEHMANEEEYIEKVATNADLPKNDKYYFTKYALQLLVSPDKSDSSMHEALGSMDVSMLMNKLMNKQTLLPFKSFYAMMNNEKAENLDVDPTFQYAKHESLPKSIRMIIVEKSPVTKLDNMKNIFEPAGDFTTNTMCNLTTDSQKALDYFIENFSLKQLEQPQKKIIEVAVQDSGNSLSQEFKEKEAKCVDTLKADLTTGLYGLYKLSFVKQMRSLLDDPKLLTITYFK